MALVVAYFILEYLIYGFFDVLLAIERSYFSWKGGTVAAFAEK